MQVEIYRSGTLSDGQFIKKVLRMPEYCIEGATVEQDEIVLLVSELNSAQTQIPKVINGKVVRIVLLGGCL